MVEEGEEVQNQETEMEAEEETTAAQANLIPSPTEGSLSQETPASQPECSSQTETASSEMEDVSALCDIAPAAEPVSAAAEEDAASVPAETK